MRAGGRRSRGDGALVPPRSVDLADRRAAPPSPASTIATRSARTRDAESPSRPAMAEVTDHPGPRGERGRGPGRGLGWLSKARSRGTRLRGLSGREQPGSGGQGQSSTVAANYFEPGPSPNAHPPSNQVPYRLLQHHRVGSRNRPNPGFDLHELPVRGTPPRIRASRSDDFAPVRPLHSSTDRSTPRCGASRPARASVAAPSSSSVSPTVQSARASTRAMGLTSDSTEVPPTVSRAGPVLRHAHGPGARGEGSSRRAPGGGPSTT